MIDAGREACNILIYVVYIYIYIRAPFKSSKCLIEDKICERKRRALRRSGPFTWGSGRQATARMLG